MNKLESFWSQRYQEEKTGWDIGSPSTPLKTYIDQLQNKDMRILIPGAGNAYEAEYLWNNGFKNTYILDIADEPLVAFLKRMNGFPAEQAIKGNFFNHFEKYDLVLEQTFFCSFPPHPEMRMEYARSMGSMIKEGGRLVGLFFNHPLTGDMEKRPFGGTKEEYLGYLDPYFSEVYMENCYNSIPPRKGNELFFIAKK